MHLVIGQKLLQYFNLSLNANGNILHLNLTMKSVFLYVFLILPSPSFILVNSLTFSHALSYHYLLLLFDFYFVVYFSILPFNLKSKH